METDYTNAVTEYVTASPEIRASEDAWCGVLAKLAEEELAVRAARTKTMNALRADEIRAGQAALTKQIEIVCAAQNAAVEQVRAVGGRIVASRIGDVAEAQANEKKSIADAGFVLAVYCGAKGHGHAFRESARRMSFFVPPFVLSAMWRFSERVAQEHVEEARAAMGPR
jgi:hypothetical protein